jgi:hypothetical protein
MQRTVVTYSVLIALETQKKEKNVLSNKHGVFSFHVT